MRALRYERILASTALALILATPAVCYAQVGTAAPEAGMADPVAPPPLPAESTRDITGTVMTPAPTPMAAPAVTPAQAAAPQMAVTAPAETVDPLAALDPADRAVAEKLRDLFAAKTDKIFAN